MRILVFTAIVILNFLISSTWLHSVAIWGIIPNTTLIIVVCYALLRGDLEGAIIGFCAGLLYDLMFGRIVGVSALLLMMTGFVAGKPFADFFKENYIAPVLLIAAASLSYEIAFYVINFLLQGRTDFFRYMGIVILPTTAYNLVLGIFIYRAIYGINNLITRREERRKGFLK
ncbi:MAG: rod shape-determining protein MreD [Defluviitaleaceae bacterium]|nr:rod shape-determining protein MreD [Defluviitaleaceae bacterium]